jgi:hypothetical protein
MAPEQALGQPVGPPVDVFALGVVLAYAATGRTPFGDGASDAVLFRVVHQPPDLSGIEGDLRRLIEECIDKHPENRPTPAQIAARCRARGITMPPAGWLPLPVSDQIGQLTEAGNFGRPDAVPASRRPLLAVTAIAALLVALASVALQVTPSFAWPWQRQAPHAAPLPSGATPSSTLSSPSTMPSETPAPSSTAPAPTARPTPRTTSTRPTPASISVNRRTPGCGESDTRVVWRTVRAGMSCSSAATTLTKQVGWDDGFLRSYAELRMSLRDQPLPDSFNVSFTVGGLSGPELDANHGGCGGLAVHTTADGRAYNYFNVCGDGWIEIVRVVDNTTLDPWDSQQRQITPGPDQGFSPSYRVTVTVNASAVTVTVSNRVGESQTVSSSAVGKTTSYLSLLTTWRNAGATASFSDFNYSAAG